ncbi:type II CRISPR RNA-guided endonuclease Cas9 [Bombilactobacillus folatiphilus]|uniref:type II CRISPR RNA-guided endonuclease Cas9 n=1 Tax=Bombilactobacillus folatiphilus TaxID=2923362 RepID=UPI00294FFD0E|nr:type II CRISPR RNA-guided endonuclease Cas9 [Bombilactobacillus folatiphilus]
MCLDIGTNSCGFAAMDMKNQLLHLQGKTAIGARLFEEGKSAAERRGFRTTRRRLKRRKWRLRLLEEFFDDEMSQVDPYFFARMRESGLSPLDHQKTAQAIVFPTPNEDHAFYCDYPTIYHLRKALMTQDKKFDLRLVYLAIHHIVKYRGNFLQKDGVDNFNASKIEVGKVLKKLNYFFAEINPDHPIQLAIQNSAEIEAVLRDVKKSKTDKVKSIGELLVSDSNHDKNTKAIASQIAKAIMGYKTQFETILSQEIDSDSKSEWQFKLSDSDADDKLAAITDQVDETGQEIIEVIQSLFGAITLSGIVDEGKSLSESMVRKYDDHKKDLKLLKQVIKQHPDRDKAQNLQLAYDLYVNNRHGQLLKAKNKFSAKKVMSKEEFYKTIEKNLDDSSEVNAILEKIALDTFMPKQRTSANGVIPFQLHQIELDQIIKNQSKYYPFLAQRNPIIEHQKQAAYKLDELIRFRVPYYVGPMITKENQIKTSGTEFAWMIRNQNDPKPNEAITPWNFDEKVDRMATANQFIKRMTTKDTYLLGEDVLPANSLLYQKFTVLNELNNLRVNGQHLKAATKQDVYENLFKQNKTVSKKCLNAYLCQSYQMASVKIEGLADEHKFNSSLKTYNQFKKFIPLSILDNADYQADLEKIIEWSTIFEDRHIYQAKLEQAQTEQISWLTGKQIGCLLKLRHQGWGSLSYKLLINLHDDNGQNIIERLWDSQLNFMQIVKEPAFKSVIDQANSSLVKDNQENAVEDVLADAYTSPANKKAIRQVVKVVADIVKAAGGKIPAKFAIEFTREPQKNPQLSKQRGKQLKEAYKEIANQLVEQGVKDELDSAIQSKQLVRDKYYLYFMQGGRDAYTGQTINIDDITTKYQIDHILPQSFIKDDSLNNRVLTASALNNAKSDDVPFKHFANKLVPDLKISVSEMWKQWQKAGMISKFKLNNLQLDPDNLDKYKRAGFVNRQLVETSQVIKLVTIILQTKYPEAEIITVKASYNHALRKRLDLYKSREVNDYHHAIDAYLSAICGNYLYQMYPNLRQFFVYGKFKKMNADSDRNHAAIKELNNFNFIGLLLQKDRPGHSTVEKIYRPHTDELLFEKHPDIFDPLRHAYSFKHMLISRETYTQDQEMFGMTLYPRLERDTKKTRTLVPKSKNLDPNIYGGYSSNTNAYLAIIKINKASESTYKVVSVPMRILGKLNQTQNVIEHDNLLKEYLAPTILDKRGVRDFSIVKGKVHYKQVVWDGNRKYMLGSATYLYNAKQLTLSTEAMRVVTGDFKTNDDESLLLDQVFDEILTKVDQYLPLFDVGKAREKLHHGRTKFYDLSVIDKKYVVHQLLIGLHDNPAQGDTLKIGFSNGMKLGLMKLGSGITLSPNTKLIYRSPTGLFEKRIKITDL